MVLLLFVHVYCVPPGRDGEYFPPLQNISPGECFWLITDNIREILFREILIGEILIGEILIGEILMTNKNLSDKLWERLSYTHCSTHLQSTPLPPAAFALHKTVLQPNELQPTQIDIIRCVALSSVFHSSVWAVSSLLHSPVCEQCNVNIERPPPYHRFSQRCSIFPDGDASERERER